MGLLSKILKRENKVEESKVEESGELTQEELDKVTAGRPNTQEWCPKVNVEGRKSKEKGELSEKELDNVTAGRPVIEEDRELE